MTETARNPAAPSLPPPPRPITPAARRRAWAEPRVRNAWLTSAALLFIAIFWTITQVASWYNQNRLVREGTDVDAAIYHPQDFNAGNRIAGRSIQERARIVLVWTVDGTEYRADTALDHAVTSGDTIPLHIDPEDPSQWTTQAEISPLGQQLIGLAIVLPAVLLTAALAWIMQRRVQSIYENGELHPAIVVETRPTALSPLSRQIRCTLQDLPDKRILTVTLPTRKGIPARGDTIHLITPPGRVTGSLAAGAYEA